MRVIHCSLLCRVAPTAKRQVSLQFSCTVCTLLPLVRSIFNCWNSLQPVRVASAITSHLSSNLWKALIENESGMLMGKVTSPLASNGLEASCVGTSEKVIVPFRVYFILER